MHVRKEKKIINEDDLLKENQNLPKRVMAGMRRRMQVCLQRYGEHNIIYRRKLNLTAYIINKNRQCFRIKHRN